MTSGRYERRPARSGQGVAAPRHDFSCHEPEQQASVTRGRISNCALAGKQEAQWTAMALTNVSEERRRRRRAGDPRLSESDREILDRITTGDLVDEFQVALDAQLIADPLLGGQPADAD
jgi:hypothetical protein